MVSLSSCAWLSVLKPALCQSRCELRDLVYWHTFIAVDEGIFDNYCAPICCSELFCLSTRLPEAAGIPNLVIGAHAARYAQHMASKKLFRAAEVGVRAT